MIYSSADYPTEERATHAEAPGPRVRLLGLAARQSVPWHHHARITDTFIGSTGPLRVVTRHPDEEHVLEAGDMHALSPETAQFVSGSGGAPCRFLIIPGVMENDHVESEGQPRPARPARGIGPAGLT